MPEPTNPTPDQEPAPIATPEVPAKKASRRSRVFFWSGSVFVILLLAAMILPNFPTRCGPSPRNSCIANLKQIDSAVQQWALENKKLSRDTYVLNEAVSSYLKGSVLPICPSGGTYSPGKTIADPPRCSLSASQGHSL